jgi:DNA-binding response OmpR family regulator
VTGVLRRTKGAPEAPPQTVGAVTLDAAQRRVFNGTDEFNLTATEFDLLAYLMRNPGRVLSRSQILRSVWGYGEDASTNVVDVYVGYLRRKLGRPDAITTVRSRGYRLEGSE